MSDGHKQLLNRIAGRLHEIFDGHIDLSDVQNKPADHQEGFFLTRAIAALALLDRADLAPKEAAHCITDGGADGGIDAVYYDEKNKVLYFVQSKWKSGGGGVHLNEFTRFRDGVLDVLALNWTSDNANLHGFKEVIESSLNDIDTSVVMLLPHTAQNPISPHINAKISEFLSGQNKYISDFIEFGELDLSALAHVARSKTRIAEIDLTVMLSQWGRRSEPYPAIYGTVSALDVVGWHEKYGQKLFVENVRYVIEKSDVNAGIIETAEKDPGNFWYFNNGITAICDNIDKQPLGGTSTESGAFDVSRISIINGAQTVGSLAKANAMGANLGDVFVHMRIISLENTPEGFAAAVTRSNNTQNDLNPVDFVSLDPNQERIRKEAEALGIVYSFRRGEPDPPQGSGFTIRAATIAAACASGDLKLAVSAKRYISGLWEDVKKEPYTILFNEQTTALYLWNIVRVMNAVDKYLEKLAEGLVGRERLIAIHGNRFILFYVFEAIDLKELRKGSVDLEGVIDSCKKRTLSCLGLMTPKINELFPDAYPGNIFKNQDRQSELLAEMPN